jgi:DNA replication initiation complex subunit (GINS family)
MKNDSIEVSRLIALLKKPFPKIERDFYRKLRKRIEEIDRKLEKMEYEEEGKELKRERENLLMYGEKIYRKRMRSLLVELSKKVTGGKAHGLFVDGF